jgi:hypothetical protein
MATKTVLARAVLVSGLLTAFGACSEDEEPAADSGSREHEHEHEADAAAKSSPESVESEDKAASDHADRADHADHAADTNAQEAEPLKLQFKLEQVQPGEEDTKCMQLRLSNKEAVNITKIHNTISTGSHHFIVTALSDKNAEETPLAPCRGFAGALEGAPLTITQKHDDTVTLPKGVGYHLNAEQVMHLEVHYINTSDKPIDVVAETALYPAAADAELEDGSVMLMGTRKVMLPPNESTKTENTFLKLPAGMEDVKFYAITGHTHQFGTNVTVHAADAKQADTGALYHPEGFDWEAPEMKQLEPHISVPKDGGFLLQCTWNNTSDSVISYGESATAEMCFFWGYYYPKKDVINIVLDDIPQDMLKRSTQGEPPKQK